jgi:hypothetical protein
MIRTIFFVPKTWSKYLNNGLETILQKGVSEKKIRIIFHEEKIGFKMNYLKRQGQGSGATGSAHWEKWVATLGRCGKRRRGEKKI